MNSTQRFCFTALSSLALVTAVSAVPPRGHQDPPPAQSAAQTQSVSGKIASVDKSSFTITVSSGSGSNQVQSTPSTTPKTITFQIDQNTTVEGKLKVNSQADVTYRDNNGQNVAISVRVTP